VEKGLGEKCGFLNHKTTITQKITEWENTVPLEKVAHTD
jgi:hypothetical protein